MGAQACGPAFTRERVNKWGVPCSPGYQGLYELLRPLGTPLVKLALFLAADRIKRNADGACSKPLKCGRAAFRVGTNRVLSSFQEPLSGLLSPRLDSEPLKNQARGLLVAEALTTQAQGPARGGPSRLSLTGEHPFLDCL